MSVAAVVAQCVIGATPAFANVAELQVQSSTKTANPDGTVTVTFGGTWLWTSLHATVNKPCDRRIGVGWAVVWNDPGDPGYTVTFKRAGLSFGAGSTGGDGLNQPEQVLYNQGDPCGSFVETDAPRAGDGNAQGQWSDTHVYQNGSTVPGVICVLLYDLAFPPAPPVPKRLLVTNNDNSIAAALRVNPQWAPTPGNGLCIQPGVVPPPAVTTGTVVTTTSPPATSPPPTSPPPAVRAAGPLAYTGAGNGLQVLAWLGAIGTTAGLFLLLTRRRPRAASARH